MSSTEVVSSAAPPRVAHSTMQKATRPTTNIPQFLIDEARVANKQSFDPKKHLSFKLPSKIYTMKDIGLEGQGISPVAVTSPFQLFTKEAIRQMRAEIFSEPVLADCRFTSPFVKNTIRGMGAARAPFTCNAWNSLEVLTIISDIAGTELVPVMDYEIAAINISVNDQTVAVIEDDKNNYQDNGDGLPVFAWHRDSYPFVCVTMLSDCTDMTGGETALKTANGEVIKVRGPSMGSAVVMQGRYIEHQALKAHGGRERISMVTSFRAKSPFVKDESVLTGVRPISNVSELYAQYTEYRVDILQERLRAFQKSQQWRNQENCPFDTADVRRFLTEQKEFLDATVCELLE